VLVLLNCRHADPRSTEPEVGQEHPDCKLRSVQGYGVVREMEHVETKGEAPVHEVLIADCGVLENDAPAAATNVTSVPSCTWSELPHAPSYV